MEIEIKLAEQEIGIGAETTEVPRLWTQLPPQQQKILAKHWARLIRQVQQGEEARDVEN
jgi:hypothetical protein